MKALDPDEFAELNYEVAPGETTPTLSSEAMARLLRGGYFVYYIHEDGSHTVRRTDRGHLALRVHRAALAAGLVI